jgi:hypothetical protein
VKERKKQERKREKYYLGIKEEGRERGSEEIRRKSRTGQRKK